MNRLLPNSLSEFCHSAVSSVKGLPVSSLRRRTLAIKKRRIMINSLSLEPMEEEEEVQPKKKDYVHYDHNDACKDSRWTSRESYQFMYARPWHKVLDFYSDVVNGRLSLEALLGECRDLSRETHLSSNGVEMVEDPDMSESKNVSSKDRSGRWARVTYKIILSYHGGSFDGWQKQPGLNTVQGLVERSIGKFVDEKKAEQLREKGFPLEAAVSVAGRTDKGVTALKQVCSFYTWRKDVKLQEIVDSIDEAAPEKLKVVSVTKVSRAFHPNFSAKWRHYFYIFPLDDSKDDSKAEEGSHNVSDEEGSRSVSDEEGSRNVSDEFESQKKMTRFEISKVNRLLHELEGKLLSYRMFARDLKPSRNTGPPTECFIYHARAAEITIPCSSIEEEKCTKAMCIELVANRFLRKMVRVLVATAIREAAAGAEDDALVKLMDATCRRATAPPAPPDGLCLVDVGYEDFDPCICLIP
ncbi:tRNA pseudouridine synthase A isoform X2 [Impatiens glandulifera]|uniref:tRNA pseudouridine synthase A isoform X2 n=1 Tax=Impatiens glandulifera TaxID=253017 RepID=UPI001FB1277B|nr:tRNA pseudouridine synthase A isoform X2 [Impatiens glandulifera]